jgi:hypothetical protein
MQPYAGVYGMTRSLVPLDVRKNRRVEKAKVIGPAGALVGGGNALKRRKERDALVRAPLSEKLDGLEE